MNHPWSSFQRKCLAPFMLMAYLPNYAAQTPCSVTVDPAPYVTMTWDAEIGGISYAVLITTDPNFVGGIQTMNAGSALSMQANTLLHGTTYYWKVRTNRAQSWEAPNYTFGTVCSFSTSVATQPPLSAPGSYNPIHNSVDIPDYQQLSWSATGGATSYQVQLSTDPAMVTGVTTFPETSNWSVEAYPLAVGTTYYWRVRARNSIGWASWTLSPIQRFDTRSASTPLTLKVFLQGPLVSTPSYLMNDGLRTSGHLPTVEPYQYIFWDIANAFSEITPSLLTTTGNNAIVDWIVVEIRHGSTNAPIYGKRWAMLVQRDGDVVMPDGTTPNLVFPMRNFKIAILHRNHLGAMTANNVTANGTTISVDLTQTSTALHGTNPTATVGTRRALWAGDCNRNGTILYTGSNNDRDLVLSAIGGVVPTNSVTGYLPTDLNMDGTVKYTGTGNDRDIILSAIGGVVPTNSRVQQLP